MVWRRVEQLRIDDDTTTLGAPHWNAYLENVRELGGSGVPIDTGGTFGTDIGSTWLEDAAAGENYHENVLNVDSRLPFELSGGNIIGDILSDIKGTIPYKIAYVSFIKLTEYLYFVNMNLSFFNQLIADDGTRLESLSDFDYVIYQRGDGYPQSPNLASGSWDSVRKRYIPPSRWFDYTPSGGDSLYLCGVYIRGVKDERTVYRIPSEEEIISVQINEIQCRGGDRNIPLGREGATFSQLRDLVDEIRIYGGVSDENEFLDRVGIGSILRVEIGDVFIEWVCNAKQTRQSREDESDRQYWFSVILRDAKPAIGPNSITIGSTIPIKITIPEHDPEELEQAISYSKVYRISSIDDGTRLFTIPSNLPTAQRNFTVISKLGQRTRLTIDSNGDVKLDSGNLLGYAERIINRDNLTVNNFVWMR